MDLGAEFDRPPHPLGRRHCGELVGVGSVPGISAEQHAFAAGVQIRARVGNLPDRQIGVADATENMLVLLPEPARELQSELDHGSVGHGVDRCLHRLRDVDRKLAQDAERQRAHAPVGSRLPSGAAIGEILERDAHSGLVLPDGDDLGAIANPARNLARERLADPAHAADRLHHGGLKVVIGEVLEPPPQARGENVVEPDRLARRGLGAEAAARILCIAAVIGQIFPRPIAKTLVERAERSERLEQNLAILGRHVLIERALARRLGQKLGDAAVEIGLDVADPLRLAAERRRGMQISVVIELDERLERNPEATAIIEDGVMVIGNPPRAWIEIEAGVEGAGLARPAELGEHVAAPDGPVPSARTIVVFEHAYPIAGALEPDRRRHSGEAGSQNDDRRPFGIAIEPDRTAVGRFGRKSEPGHHLIGAGAAEACADKLDQSAPAQRGRRGVAHPSTQSDCHD